MRKLNYNIENMMVRPDPREVRVHDMHFVTREEAEDAAYAATERRLRNMQMIRERVEDQKEELAELENLGVEALRHHSSSFVSMLRPGMRIDEDEAHTKQMAFLRGSISTGERELRKLTVAMECLRNDPYYRIMELRYVRGMGDMDIAEKLCCDKATVCRHRRQLVRKLSVRLYGSF